jgi:hypothetical protein
MIMSSHCCPCTRLELKTPEAQRNARFFGTLHLDVAIETPTGAAKTPIPPADTISFLYMTGQHRS